MEGDNSDQDTEVVGVEVHAQGKEGVQEEVHIHQEEGIDEHLAEDHSRPEPEGMKEVRHHILQVHQGTKAEVMAHQGTKAEAMAHQETKAHLEEAGHMMVNSLSGRGVGRLVAAALEVARTENLGEVPGEAKTRLVDCHCSTTVRVALVKVLAVPQEQTVVGQRRDTREQAAYLLQHQPS